MRWFVGDHFDWDWWDFAAIDRPDFKLAVGELVAAGCEANRLRWILGLIHECQQTSSSPDDIRRSRKALDDGRQALLELHRDDRLLLHSALGIEPSFEPREERWLLDYSIDDADAALRVLGDLSRQLRKLQRGADRRRSRLRDRYRAVLVSDVKQQTGKLHDRLVCDLLNGAMAPEPEIYQVDVDEFEREAPPIWDGTTVEAHRRWRIRNKKLIEKPPQLEEQWREHLKQKVLEEQPQPRPQRLWAPDIHGKGRRNRGQTG